MKSLQEMYNYYGATEMYVRIATTRYYPDESVDDYYHAKMHCLEESKKVCALAAGPGMPINVELGVNVMLAEYGYANETGLASGAFSSWNNKVHGYELNDEDEARFLTELIRWGKNNGMAGIRPWACEYDWAMPWFDFAPATKVATAKTAVLEALKSAPAA